MTTSDAPATRFTGSGMEYLDFGGGPHGTVVFAHGYRDSARGWATVAHELVDRGWSTLAVQRKPAPQHIDDSGRLLDIYADQVVDVVETVSSAEERVVLAGQSMGGAVAELAASRVGSRAHGLVLITPAPLGGTPLPEEVRASFESAAQISDPVLIGTGKLTLCVDTTDETKRRLIASTPVESPEAILQSLSAWVGGHEQGRRSSSVTAATLLATTDDTFFTADLLRQQVALRFEQIRVEAVHGAGHFPHLERPAELAEVIAKFLQALAPSPTGETTPAGGGKS